jgi:hypothetical protein
LVWSREDNLQQWFNGPDVHETAMAKVGTRALAMLTIWEIYGGNTDHVSSLCKIQVLVSLKLIKKSW